MTNPLPDRAPLTFSEVVLKGSLENIRAYLIGLAETGRKCLTFWFHMDAGIEAGRHDVYLLASDDIVALLREHAPVAAERRICEIVTVAPVHSASFTLEYRVFSALHDREIHDLLYDLPPSLRLADEQHEVKIDPKAIGIEVYTPAHDYEASGSAKIVGRVDLVIAKRKQLREHELIRAQRIVLELG
jgi:hypothetical protein